VTKEELNEYHFTRSYQTANAYIGHWRCHYNFLEEVCSTGPGKSLGDVIELVEKHHKVCEAK